MITNIDDLEVGALVNAEKIKNIPKKGIKRVQNRIRNTTAFFVRLMRCSRWLLLSLSYLSRPTQNHVKLSRADNQCHTRHTQCVTQADTPLPSNAYGGLF